MTWEIAFVFAVVVVALALFAFERFPSDQVALAIPVLLLLAGIITPQQAVSGFSSTATITVAAMLALGLGLTKSGAVAAIGRWARTAPLGGPHLRLLVLCILAAAVSAFLNNTPVVVVFLPVFLSLARQADKPPSLYLIPLSYAAILGGTVTLVGTSTNLVVYGMASGRGLDGLGLFSIAPLGLIYMAAGLTYLFTVGRRLLPSRPGEADLAGKYAVREFVTELEATEESPSVNRTLRELRWRELYEVSVLGMRRGERVIWAPGAERRVLAGDIVYVQGAQQQLWTLTEREKLRRPEERKRDALDLYTRHAGLLEVLVAPPAPLAGHTLGEIHFRQRYGVTVLAAQHRGNTMREHLGDVRYDWGDVLLVHGPPSALAVLAEESGFVALSEVDAPAARRPRALIAAFIMAVVIVVATLGVVGIMPAALAGVVLMLFTRCLRLQDVYAELDWMVIFLLAGLIPLGTAIETTGAARWLVETITVALGHISPTAAVGGFYLITVLLTEVMSNNATAVVMTPVAILAAANLGMNPYALLVAVMFGASASFMTPIGYQTNTMIYGPGGYRFTDFFRVGAPLALMLFAVATVFIPIFWPS